MTEVIIELMEKRRTYKNKDKYAHNTINSQIRRMIREAKEKCYEEKCDEIEQLRTTILTYIRKLRSSLAGTF